MDVGVTEARLILTLVDTVNGAQPPAAGILYVTVYNAAALLAGVTAPVAASRVSPAGVAVNVPPVVPVRLTGCEPVKEVQYGLPE